MHAVKGMMHRDIKPNNLGIVSINPPRGIILDLDTATDEKFPTDHSQGTDRYKAPEIVGLMIAENKSNALSALDTLSTLDAPPSSTTPSILTPYDTSVDIWALGFCAIGMMHQWLQPWYEQDQNQEETEENLEEGIGEDYISELRWQRWRSIFIELRMKAEHDDKH